MTDTATVARFQCPAGHEMPAKEWCGDCGTHVVPVVASFTREDVKALRAAAQLIEDLNYFNAGRPEVLRSLADRLESLLPPE